MLVRQSCHRYSFGLDDISMTKGKKEKKVRTGSDMVDICLELWKKGYRIRTQPKDQENQEEDRAATFNETLISVAGILESTNAKKASYFRHAVPYPIHYQGAKFLAVDFPTRGNSLKRTVEEFELANKPSIVSVLHHGTNLRNVPSILKCGLKRSLGGMLGQGIYLGKLQKAKNYSDLIIFEVKVVLGCCKELVGIESLCDNEDHDSLHIKSGKTAGVYKGWLANEEWIVRYPEQVEISRLICGVNEDEK